MCVDSSRLFLCVIQRRCGEESRESFSTMQHSSPKVRCANSGLLQAERLAPGLGFCAIERRVETATQNRNRRRLAPLSEILPSARVARFVRMTKETATHLARPMKRPLAK